MKKIIVIVGATATKKSYLAMEIAKFFNIEIINADAFQIYKEINIGINKPSIENLNSVKHHFVNEKHIDEEWNIKIFQNEATKIIPQIIKRGNIPLICGGSNLYVDALIKGYNLEDNISRNEIDIFNNKTNQELFDYIFKNDQKLLEKININNRIRLIRACQLIYFNQLVPISIKTQNNEYIYDLLIIHTIRNREKLYEVINNRTDMMVDNNWKKEVENLYFKNININELISFRAIGYDIILDSVLKKTNINIEKIKQKTRNLAKRQLTWINNKTRVDIEFNIDEDNIDLVIKKINEFINRK